MQVSSTPMMRHSWLYFVLFVAAGSYGIGIAQHYLSSHSPSTLTIFPWLYTVTLHWLFSPGVSVAAADCINTVKQRWRCDNYGLGLSECYVNHGTASTWLSPSSVHKFSVQCGSGANLSSSSSLTTFFRLPLSFWHCIVSFINLYPTFLQFWEHYWQYLMEADCLV